MHTHPIRPTPFRSNFCSSNIPQTVTLNRAIPLGKPTNINIPFPPSLPYLSLINLNMHSEHIIHSLQSILKQRTNPHPLSNLYHPPIHPIHPITTPISSTNSTHKHDRLQNMTSRQPTNPADELSTANGIPGRKYTYRIPYSTYLPGSFNIRLPS
ncbi:hypothetical protein BCIN_03g06790 [Botrytis cinerea B05.10]|uniref:Uncharacterized protein n=1 Tax=Botryotinia fuckeliana (strain B05.10) TaxID=332648 RepID=A0A384JCY6_BOTFB|nr:hypothetical protein BCIN_03g06790 [Botrytis cinerea B05.10]ATZ48459.1 hypothetical protein BCIN_03g06790 [Botrytis cinerea B05.10]